jgi:hypothetical protein
MPTQKQEILAAFDEVFSHKWESLGSALDGVTQEEAQYQHPIYENAQSTPGLLNGSILWHVSHLEVCYRHYALGIRLRPEPPPKTEYVVRAELIPLHSLMIASRAELRTAIAEVDDNAFDDVVWHGDPLAQFIRMITRHDAWHAAQIAVARRLYRMR